MPTDFPEFRPPAQSTLLSVLEHIERPGYAIRNALRGNFAGAGRQLKDFLGETVDAAIPFVDAYRPTARHEDFVSGSEFVGAGNLPSLARAPIDAAVSFVTNPLSAVSFGRGRGVRVFGETVAGEGKTLDPLTLAGKGLGRATDAVLAELPPRAAARVRGAGTWGKRALGWDKVTPQQQKVLEDTRTTGNLVARANAGRIIGMLKGITPAEDKALAMVMHNVRKTPDGRWEVLDPVHRANRAAPQRETLEQQRAYLRARLQTLLAKEPELAKTVDVERAAKALDDLVTWNYQQWTETQDLGGLAQGARTGGSVDYLMRSFRKERPDDVAFADARPNSPNALRRRALEDETELAAYLNANPKVDLELSAIESAAKRAIAQGRIATRAALGQELAKDAGYQATRGVPGAPPARFALAEQGDRDAANAVIERLRSTDPDYAHRLDAAFNGIPPPNWFMETLRSANQIFKPAAVFGVVIPRVGAGVRNQIGGINQVLATEGTGKAVLPLARRTWANVKGAIDDYFLEATGARKLQPDELTQALDAIDDAFRAGSGSAKEVVARLRAARPELADALEWGVLDDFVREEDLIKQIANPASPWWKMWDRPLWRAPAKYFQGVEQRMRLGTFLELRKQGTSVPEAADLTKSAFLRYESWTPENANFRTIIPFAQFQSQTIPQQAGWLSRQPGAAVALGGLFSTDPNAPPIYEYIAEQPHLRLGQDREGNELVAAGLSLPVEALDLVPNISGTIMETGRQIERGIVGSSQPLLKTAYSVVTGQDPFFKAPFGQYDKVPIAGEGLGQDAGRLYNVVAGTGLIQPLSVNLIQLDRLLDQRKSVPDRALGLLTGARVVSVDPDRALAEQLTDYLERNPNVQQRRSLYTRSDDPETQALLRQLRTIRSRMAERRREQAAAGT
jgi:hypothetical protein